MEKRAIYTSINPEVGRVVLPLFGTREQERELEKTAGCGILPEAAAFIQTLQPKPNALYILVTALGAGEYYGPNSWGDWFAEDALTHMPQGWTGKPVYDKTLASKWPWGHPTFYTANFFVHHQNKDETRALGVVEFTAWNPRMKRVELVIRLDHDKCEKYGGSGIWQRVAAGGYPDVSMGAYVPFDLCSITLDADEYVRVRNLYYQQQDRSLHEGAWIARWHKRELAEKRPGIRGLQITKADYSTWCKHRMRDVLEDGRKVYVFNPHPRFFDISGVFVGADKTAKMMIFIAGSGSRKSDAVVETLRAGAGKEVEGVMKTASALPPPKLAAVKRAQIEKRVPAEIAGDAVKMIERKDPSISPELMQHTRSIPLGPLLSTMSLGGLVLSPKEFQRLLLSRIGSADEADDLERGGICFGKEAPTDLGLDHSFFDADLAKVLDQLLPERSGFGPFVERRITICVRPVQEDVARVPSHSQDLLRKIGSAYAGYRRELLGLVQFVDTHGKKLDNGTNFHKLAAHPLSDLFTPLASQYFNSAYL